MAATLTPYPRFRVYDTTTGLPLAGGKVYTFETGTATAKDTYTDADAGTTNANPVILDSAGEADIWFDGNYRVRVDDSDDNVIMGPIDDIASDSTVKTWDDARYAADAVGTDAYAITLAPVPSAYYTGMLINFKASTANTGACSIDVNSLGVKAIKTNEDIDPKDGDIRAGQMVTIIYDGTNFQMQSQKGARESLRADLGRYAADAEASDTYAITLSPVPAAYYNGMVVNFKANTANTAAATLNVNTLGAIAIKKYHDQDLETGDIEANQIVSVVYNSSTAKFQMQSQLASEQTIQGKNAIINPAMLHAQRGASGSAVFTDGTNSTNADDTYLLDRWNLLSDGNNIVDVSQSTDAPAGALLSCGLDVETVNKKFGVCQVIEQKNCEHMIGGTVSLSFEAKVDSIAKLDNIKAVVLSWDSTADTVTSDVVSAWNAEDTTPTFAANWTAENTPANMSVTAAWGGGTGIGGRYKIEDIDIDTASTTNIAVFIWSDGFCDTAANLVYITNVQLEPLEGATEFVWPDVTTDLSSCQRYYAKSYLQATVPATATSDGDTNATWSAAANADHIMTFITYLPTTMRTTATIVLYDTAGTSGKVTMSAGAGIAGTVTYESDRSFSGSGTNGAVATTRILRYHYTADCEL